MTQHEQKKNILVADDNEMNWVLLQDALTKYGYNVRAAQYGEAVIEDVKLKTPDLIFLDIKMPKMNGFETCEILKADSRYRDIPIIFINSCDQKFTKVKAFELGAVDSITLLNP